MNRPIAFQGGLGGVTPPDQIIGRTGIETLGFTAGCIHHHRPAAGRSLIALTAQRATIETPLLERGTAAAGAGRALGAAHGTALAAAAATAGSIKAGTLETTLAAAGAVKAGAISGTATGGLEPALTALRTAATLRPAASEGGAIRALGGAVRTIGAPLTAGRERAPRTAAGIRAARAGGTRPGSS